MSNEEIKRRITILTKKQNIDEEVKTCLLQVIHLINNLDGVSNDSITNSGDESINFDMVST